MSAPTPSHPVTPVPFAESAEAARERLARMVWLEARLFEVVGSWVAPTPDHGLKVWLRQRSLGHAARAEWWGTLLPVSGPEAPGGAEGVPGPGEVALVEAMSRLSEPSERARAEHAVTAGMATVVDRAACGLGPPAGGPEGAIAARVASQLLRLTPPPGHWSGPAPAGVASILESWDPWRWRETISGPTS